jgi:hypothetical protein
VYPPRRSRRRLVLLGLSLLCAGVLPAAGEPAKASGKFAGTRVSFDVGGAYAFWNRGQDRLIEVAVSNDPFRASAFDAFYDPRPVISSRFADDQAHVVYFEFEPDGKYHGLSYYFGSGDGCGFCYDTAVKSTVRIEKQRVKGRIAFKEPNRDFDIQLDVPIAPEEWGQAISGEGGEIGAAYHGYNAAWDKDDHKGVFDRLDSANQRRWKKIEQEDKTDRGRLDRYITFREHDFHWNLKEEDARIVGGYVRGDQAVLLVKAKNTSIDRIHGQVTLTRENGRWKIGDEVYELGE